MKKDLKLSNKVLKVLKPKESSKKVRWCGTALIGGKKKVLNILLGEAKDEELLGMVTADENVRKHFEDFEWGELDNVVDTELEDEEVK